MKLGIDIGISCTTMAVSSRGQIVYSDADWLSPVPSLAAWPPSSEGMCFGNDALQAGAAAASVGAFFSAEAGRNSDLGLRQFSPDSVLNAFLVYLATRLPSAIEAQLESVTLAVPHYCGINRRRSFLTALRQAFPEAASYLLPEPCAALIGYQALHPEQIPEGDVLIIDSGKVPLDFSFMSTASSAGGLVLETQLTQGHALSLPEFVDTVLKPRAQALGLLADQDWRLDAILLLGDLSSSPELSLQLQDLFAGIPMFLSQPEQPCLAAGSCLWQETGSPINAIYPFSFYVEKKIPQGGTQLELIPFDSANLELSMTGRYRLTSLAARSACNLANAPGDVEIKIYAMPHSETDTGWPGPAAAEMVMHWQQSGLEADDVLDIEFDMAASQLSVNLTATPVRLQETDILADWRLRQLSQAQWLSAYKHVDPNLLEALIKALQSGQDDHESCGSSQIKASYYKLLAMLQILNP